MASNGIFRQSIIIEVVVIVMTTIMIMIVMIRLRIYEFWIFHV